jgi:dephospho-CoA kinase
MKALFGDDVYRDGELDRTKVAAAAFTNRGILEQMNEVIHPATIAYGQKWLDQQTSPYAIKEAAIFFESGSNKNMDVMIGVSAPLEVRIQRVIERDGVSREKVMGRIARQMNEDEKMKLCDHVIINDGNTAIMPQALQLHELLLKKAR